MLSADTWRHVAVSEQKVGRKPPTELCLPQVGPPPTEVDPHMPQPDQHATTQSPEGPVDVRWLMSSDVCKHCTHAACLDVCPTGALFRTEFGTVVVQEDVCNGCGYCIPACPYGVIDQRKGDGRA